MAGNFAQILITAKDDTRGGVASAEANFARLEQRAGRASESLRELGTNVANSFKNIALGLGAGFGLNEIARTSDAFSTLNAQLRISTGSAAAATAAYGEVFRIAQSSGQSLQQVATVYRRFSDSAADIGISQREVAEATQIVAQSISISGGSASSAEAALTQFGQALASGTLRGEELNSVLEQAPRLARALADGLGVPVGKLKELAESGAITSQAIVAALRNQRETVEREFTELPLTVGRALTNLDNAFTNTVGSFEQGTGAFRTVAEIIDGLAQNFDALAGAAGVLAGVMASRVIAGLAAATTAKIAATRETRNLALAELAAAQAAQQAATARAAATLNMGTLTTATQRLATAQAVVASTSRLGMALGALGGPIGLVTTALSLGATAWMLWGDSSSEAADKAKRATEQSTSDIVASLDVQIAKLRDRNKLAASGMPGLAQQGGDAAERVAALQARMQQIQRREGQFAGINDAAQMALLQQTGLELAALLQRTRDLAVEQKKLQEIGPQSARDRWLEKYATDAERLNAELAKARQELGGAFTPEVEQRIRAKFTVKDKKAPKGDSERMQREAQELVDNWSPLKLRWELDASDFDGGANADLAKWQEAANDRLDDLIAKYRDLADPAEKYRKELQVVTALEAQGKLTAEEAYKVRKKLIEEEEQSLEERNNELRKSKSFAEEFGLTMSSAFENAILAGKGFSDLLQGLSRDIAQVIIRKTVTEPLGSAVSDFAKGIDWSQIFSFGGRRATGGPVRSGKLYEVNETGGPGELLTAGGRTFLMANQDGYVTPTQTAAGGGSALGGSGGNVTIIQHINVDARSDQAAIQAAMLRAREEAVGAVRMEIQRGGALARAVGR